jgi:hypothetical protein
MQVCVGGAGRGEKVLEEMVQPDYERLFDQARLDLILAHLAREAAEVVGEEIVEVGRHPGRLVRAVGRTCEGRTVAAVVPGDEGFPLGELQAELEGLRRVFGDDPIELVYGVRGRGERALEVELVPPGQQP